MLEEVSAFGQHFEFKARVEEIDRLGLKSEIHLRSPFFSKKDFVYTIRTSRSSKIRMWGSLSTLISIITDLPFVVLITHRDYEIPLKTSTIFFSNP
jgi:hypothetical protein